MRLATATILVLLSSASELVSALPSSRPKQRSVLVRRTKCQARSAAPEDGLPAPSSPPAPPEAPPVNRGSCFPSLDFQMPEGAPSSSSIDSWWCDPNTEYGFLGISYSVSSCQSLDQIKREFKDIRTRFSGRYVRIYGACDRPGFYDDIVEAAWGAKLGVHALIWFGFEGGNAWMNRRDVLFNTLRFNPKARFVTRVVQFGSEPLFDSAIDAGRLADEVRDAKAKLGDLRIPVTVSEMRFGYEKFTPQASGNVLDAIDLVDMHSQPFFSSALATPVAGTWPLVAADLGWFFDRTGGKKKVILSQNGWPTALAPNISPNSAFGIAHRFELANIQNQQDYYDMLDSHCADLKNMPGGGVGWFAHMYSDSQDTPGHGLYDVNNNLKIRFSPRTSC